VNDFTGFPQAGLEFLTRLGTKNKAWFDENRKTYDTEVVPHAKTFVVELGELLADRISGGIEYAPKTNGSIAPINNDLRFNPDASPYKDHLLFKFWEGPNKKTAPMLWVRMSPTDGIGFASGIMISNVDRWRTAIDENGQPFANDLGALVKAVGADVAGEGLKKVPKPYNEDHPRGDLLKHKGFQVRWSKKAPASITKPAFAPWCAGELERSSKIHHWLVEYLGE
jgi:uncharacterized protein (TIGR02453 family)